MDENKIILDGWIKWKELQPPMGNIPNVHFSFITSADRGGCQQIIPWRAMGRQANQIIELVEDVKIRIIGHYHGHEHDWFRMLDSVELWPMPIVRPITESPDAHQKISDGGEVSERI